jgi:hypothetical protein
MENHTERVTLAAAQATDAVAELCAVYTARSSHRSLLHCENHGIALPQGDDLRAGLHPRPLLGQNEFPTDEIPSWLRQKHRELKGEHVFAIQILVKTVVIVDVVPEQQRRGSMLASRVTAR